MTTKTKLTIAGLIIIASIGGVYATRTANEPICKEVGFRLGQELYCLSESQYGVVKKDMMNLYDNEALNHGFNSKWWLDNSK